MATTDDRHISAGNAPAPAAILAVLGDDPASIIGRLFPGSEPADGPEAVAGSMLLRGDLVWRLADLAERPLLLATGASGDAIRTAAAAASAADHAVVAMDVNIGFTAKTRRDLFVAALMGCRRIVLAVEGLAGESLPAAFRPALADFEAVAGPMGVTAVSAVPSDDLLRNLAGMPRDEAPAPPTSAAHHADQFASTVLWFDEYPLIPGRSYMLRTQTDSVSATVTDLKYQVEMTGFARVASKELATDEIGSCNISTERPIDFATYADDRAGGAFLLTDRLSGATAGIGVIRYPLRRASNIRWQALDVNREARAEQKRQKPAVIWLTGLSGSGKSTIANLVEKRLFAEGKHTYILDGDNVRHGLNRDLGFTEADRVENVRRVAEVARLMADAGMIVLVSFISPFRAEREMARRMMADIEFFEVYVDTPFDECAARDPKGLYKRALAGEIKNFTGLDSPYEPPEHPDIHLRTLDESADALTERLFRHLSGRGVV